MKKITVVGATNIDIVAKSYNELKLFDKNPGKAIFSYGGVGRNICENLARLELNPTFVTIVGKDEVGKNAMQFLKDLNVNVLAKKSSLPTSTFISILNHESDSYISISSMDIVDTLDSQFLEKINFDDSEIIVCDANSTKVANYLGNIKTKLFVDATSDAKANKIANILPNINYLKCTKSEMETLFKTTDINNVINTYPNLNLIVTNKDKPVFFNVGSKVMSKNVTSVNVVSAIGAGDSFSAGIIYGLVNNYPINKCVDIAIKMSMHSIQQDTTVSTLLSKKMIGE
ncbi:MAG: PfkB family carbohydrate kinase [Bacilli bacterium]